MRECEINASSREIMLRSAQDLIGYSVHATDKEVGVLTDIFFDDEKWVIRNLVVETDDREVLMSPITFESADWDDKVMRMNLSAEEISKCPDIDTNSPISRLKEKEYYDFYGWPYYWGGNYAWGSGMYPYRLGLMGVPVDESGETELEVGFKSESESEGADTHLRSADTVIGYEVEALDGNIGKVEDFIFDDACFDIKFVVVDTGSFWSSNRVLVPASGIVSVEWEERKMFLRVSKEHVRSAPHWEKGEPVSGELMKDVQEHYDK